MAIKVAFILRAKKEITLTAGQRNKNENLDDQIVIAHEDSEKPFLNIGYTNAPEISLTGIYIENPGAIAEDLSISYYLPEEESPKEAKPINLSLVTINSTILPRQKAEKDNIWYYKIEARGPIEETMFFDTGFHPPLKEKSVSIHLEHLCNYNCEGYLLSNLIFSYKTAYYIENEWGFSLLEHEGDLPD